MGKPPRELPVPISEANAKSVIKLALMPLEGSPSPSSTELSDAVVALRGAGWNLDDPALGREVLGSISGGGLLHKVAWLAGSSRLEMEGACRLAKVLLDNGADPNAGKHGYRPVDMLVAGVSNGPDQCADIELLVDLLVQRGLNHEVPGKYSLEDIGIMLRKEGVPDNVINLLEVGPQAVSLDQSTPTPTACRARRTL